MHDSKILLFRIMWICFAFFPGAYDDFSIFILQKYYELPQEIIVLWK